MLKWFSNDESGPNQAALESQEGSSSQSMAEVTDQLAQTQQLVAQLKELIREKDSNLQAKDEQLKTEKDSFEAKLSKLKLQNKAKVTSLNAQLEDLKKQLAVSGGKVEIKKSGGDGDQEHASASRGKILLLKKKTEELEHQLLQKEAELTLKTKELEAQRQRGMEMDAMLAEKNRKLAEKEAYIIDLQMTVGGDITTQTHQPQVVERKSAGEPASMQELQLLVQHLTKKVEESEERYSLLQEQTESLKELLVNEKAQFEKRENMYKENIQTFKDIILQKDTKLTEINQMHEQELFRLAAKSDASADLEQLLKALKQKLHEKEEVLLGKTQVINVLQGEVDAKDQQIKDLAEKMQRLHVEKDNMQSKLDAERHVMRAQLRDLMQKHEEELQRVAEKHEHEVLEKEQSLYRQLEELRSTPAVQPAEERPRDTEPDSLVDMEVAKKLSEMEAHLKVKAEEASKSEAKFLKMKAWSKSRIRQLEDELRKAQSGCPGPDMNTLQNRITDLEEERQELLCKLDQYDELKTKNDQLIAKLVSYEEQQRKMQADLEQVTKRAASQTSESGSADELQSQVLEWQDMVLEAEAGREQARGEKAALVMRMSHIEEEREGLIEDDWFFPGCSDPVLVSRQQELEEELAQAGGLRQQKGKRLAVATSRSLQEDFEFEKQTYPDPKNALESTASTEGENMGGWWPEYRTSDAGLRSVVEELELERNQLQEQIVGLEERCQDLEDRLQMQARIESLQTETERLQAQLAGLRSQQSREVENHQLLVASLNEQLKGLSETQECLETSLMEKEHTLAKASEKLEFIDNLTGALKEKENQYKEVTEKLLQAEHNLSEVAKKCSSYEKQCSDLKKSVADLTQKTSMLKDKAQKQETTIVSLQNDLEQTNDELDKLNSTHLEERAQLIHDLQSCEREIDSLKDILADKDKEICVLSNSMTEYSEQIFELKRDIKLKEEDLVRMETALTKTEREAQVMRDSQSSDQQALNTKITQLTEQLKVAESELDKVKEEINLKTKEVEELMKQVQTDDQNIKNLCGEIQKLTVNHQSHLLECESQISSLKDQVTVTSLKLQDSESHLSQTNVSIEKLKVMLQDKERTYEKELKCVKDECNQLIAEAVKAEEKIKNLSEKLENISISQEEAENEQVNLNQKLKARNSDNERLQQALQAKSESISRLEMDVKFLESANQQLKAAFGKEEEELSKQKKLIEDLNENISITYDQHASLKSQFADLVEENKKLQQEIAYKDENKLALAEELNSKMSVYELQHSESQKTIEGLQKDKEKILLRNEELGKVLEQNKISMSGMLLEKTNECSHLAKLVSESKENITQLHYQVSHLNAQLEEARGSLTEKEKIILDKNAHCEMQQSQLEQTVTTLKAGLMEKESLLHQGSAEVNSLQNEVMLHKQFTTQLQADNESLQMENLRLSQGLEEKEANLRSYSQEYEKFLNEYNKMTESTVSMSSQIEENNKTILMLESANVDIKKSLETQVADNIKVQEQLSQSQTEIKGLQNHLQALNEENQQLHVALQKEKEELVEQKKLVTDLNERNDMTSEQISENRKIIQVLMKEKEDLTERIEELKHSEQDKTFLSESLFEKTNECSLLTQLLSESKESVAGLHNHVALLNAEIEEFKVKVSEKDQMIRDQNSNQEQLQETLSLLQEQGIALKAGLMEKDALLQQRDVELRSLRSEILQQKECCSQIEEDMKSAVDKQSSDNCMLRETLSQNQTELIELHNRFQALNEENNKIKTEYHNLAAEASKTVQEIVVLQAESSNQKNEVVSLTKKLRALEEENEQMHLSLQQKTESVNQQEMFIKQLKDQLEQGKSQMDTITELQSQIQFMQKTMQDKERSSQEKETQLKQLKEKAVTASDALTTQISDNIETISNLQAEIMSLLEKNKELNMSIAEKDGHLKNKVDDYLSLRAKYSELEDMDLQLRDKVDSLSLESIQLKKMLKEKEETLIEIQSTSLANSDILNTNYKTKDAECETLKQQVSMLQEDVSKLKDKLCAQSSEIAKLQETLAEKEATALEQIKALQNLQTKADEAALFKTQFMESTELVSELQRQVQENSLEYRRLNKYAQEKQSALSDLQHKYAINLEELFQKNEEINNLNKLLTDSKDSNKTAENTADVLSSEIALLREELQHIQASHAELSKQKEEALTTHQVHASNLMVEIEGLRSQHLQVAAQVNALTQNLEQRELALYEINNQYTVQVKRGEHLLSENQKIREENKKLREDSSLNKDLQWQLDAAISEKESFQKAITEKEDLCKSYSDQLQMLKEEFELQHQQHLGSMSEAMEKMMTEKEHLQLQVSAKIEEITGLKLDIQKMTQTLQESEKEWLSILDKEIQEKNLFTEQLRHVENEMKSKDVKVQALKQDLDTLQQKSIEVMAALNISSDQLKSKDLQIIELGQQVSENRNHLEEILSAIHKKESEIFELTQTLKHKENELQSCEKDLKEFSETMTKRLIAFEEEKSSLQTTINQLKSDQQSEVYSLKKQLDETVQLLQEKQCELLEKDKVYHDNDERLCLLHDQVRHLKEEVQIRSKDLEVAGVSQSSILCEVQKKDDTISSINIQLNQQKELISSLTQQLKEKDVSVTQVMVSASNEMVRHTEEKDILLSQLESLENTYNQSVRELENISTQLEESKTQLFLYKEQLQTKDLENKDLIKENDQLKIQYDRLCKEKEVMRKKLQAALVIRKDLLKKIDGYEKQIKENENIAPEFSVLQDKLKELTLQVQTISKHHESQTDELRQQIMQKEEVINELTQDVSRKDLLLEQMSHNIHCLQTKFDEQEENLTNTLHLLHEKSEIINSFQFSIAAKEETHDHERCKMMMDINILKEEMEKKENLYSEIEKELSLVKQEKEVQEKKAYAALIARKEIMKKYKEIEKRHAQEVSGLKEEFNKLLEENSKQRDEFNAVQIKYAEKVKELENVQHSLSLLEYELDSAKSLIVENEKKLNSLDISMAERDWQVEAITANQGEIECLHHKLEKMTFEMGSKDALIVSLEEHSKDVSLQLMERQSELEKAHIVMREKMEKILRLEQEINTAHEQHKYDKQEIDNYADLHSHLQKSQAEVEDLKHAIERIEGEKEKQCEELKKLNKELNDANIQIKEELEKAHSIIAEKSFQLQTVENNCCQEREFLKKELERIQADSKYKQTEIESNKLYIETLEKEKLNAFIDIQNIKSTVNLLETKLNESEKLREELLKKLSVTEKAGLELDSEEEFQSLKSYAKQLEVSLKEKEDGFLNFQALIKEKEQLIASLEQQLQREVHLHEVSMEQMKTVINELQQNTKEVPDACGPREQVDESKQMAKKLQAALISRKEALKENQSLKQQIQALRSENEEIHKSTASLEKSLTELKQQKEHLESSVLSLGKEKDKLILEVDQILSDNHNLSAACESLKLTIENITHQKQAFSCQLESLKDSQTVELSEWRSKHTELKHEYESLLQAYENVSNEMDKMRQLLEVARKEKQEILLRVLQTESEKTQLEKHIIEAKNETEKMKEKIQELTGSKRPKIQDLEAENEKIRKQMQEFEEQKYTIENLTAKNSELEEEINSLKISSIEIEDKMNKFQSDNVNLVEELKVSNNLLEKWQSESKGSLLNMQLKMEEMLNLNNTLTSTIEAQKADILHKTEVVEFLQKKLNLAEKNADLQKNYDAQLEEKDNNVRKLRKEINGNFQEINSLNEKIRILEDDKSLLQEELENVQELSEKVKNEKEYLETMLLKNSEKIDELTEAVHMLEVQNKNLSTQLTSSKEEKSRDDKEQQLKLKEFEEKLKVLQKGSEGSKSIKMELQELLKEKHQEINQLHKDCITYQELILELESSLKSAQSKGHLMEKEMNNKISAFEERIKSLETEIMSYKVLLSEARDEIASINFEKEQLKEKLTRKDAFELGQNLELLDICDHNAQIEKLEHDKNVLNAQFTDKESSVCEMQSHLVKLKNMLSESESKILLVQADNDQLRIDLEKQKAIAGQLKSLVHNKDSEISMLLSSSDGQMLDYLEHLQKHHKAQTEDYGAQLNVLYSEREEADKTSIKLEAKVKRQQGKMQFFPEEKMQLIEKQESVRSSPVSSLMQTEKEHLFSDRKTLEQKHKSNLWETEGSGKENLNENSSEQDIKTLIYQIDDLNSENAMLKAQLIRYREDLNQVLSLKDNQLKELLKKEQDSLKNILSQKTSVEYQLREALMDLQEKEEANDDVKVQNSKLATQVQELNSEVLALKKQKAEMKETKVISDLQEQVAAKAAECNDLQQKLLAQKMTNDDLKRETQELEVKTRNHLAEASNKYNNALNAFEREVDLMRNERETAENRVAELAKELMQTEQLLAEAKNLCKTTEAQNQSLAKAMAALQDDRDHLIDDFKVLHNKYDTELRETTAAMNKIEGQLRDTNSELISLTKERYILIQKLSAFESDNTHSQLTKQIDELCCIISEKETELNRLSQENDMYNKQMAAFSGSMASLQDDRDRLIQELAKAKRGFESRQGTSASTATPVGSEEINLNSSFDVLQTERNRLLKEVGSLKSENADLEKALQEAQASRWQTEIDVKTYQVELAELKSERNKLMSEHHSLKQPVAAMAEKENSAPLAKDSSGEQLPLLLAERRQLESDLQRCLQEIHQRDLRFQQVNAKLLQTVEEKMGLASQLKTMSQTLRDTQLNLGDLQNRCYWLESQMQTFPGQSRAHGAVAPEVPPGAPQERSITVVAMDTPQASELRTRLVEVEQQLVSTRHDLTQLAENLREERARRQVAEDALGLAEERVNSMNASISRASQGEFTIHLESEDEREALIIDPSENVVTRKMKGGVLSCKRWLRGRSLYCSKLLTSRAKSRYLFLAYLLTLHVIVFMCFTGTL